MEESGERCRLCLSDDVIGQNIFQTSDEHGVAICTKIMLCTSLMVSPDDFFSKFVCSQCSNMLDLFFEFRNTCLKTHISMHNVVQAISNSDAFLIQVNNEKNVDGDPKFEEDPLQEDKLPEVFNLMDDPRAETNNNGVGCDRIDDGDGKGLTGDDDDDGDNLMLDLCGNKKFQVGCYVPLLDEETDPKGDDGLLRRFKCINCKTVFPSLSELDAHWDICQVKQQDDIFKLEDFSDKLLEGDGEGLYFEEDDLLNVVTNSGLVEKPECSTKKRKKSSKGNREYCCETCGKVFKQLLLLKRHIQAKHIGTRPFSCSHCPRSFFDKYELKYHQRLHEDVEDFCCNVCGRRFARRSGLKAHMRSHTGEKPFECKLCDKSFAHLNSLIAHERVHTGERPYSCRYCFRTFGQYSTAKSHEEMHMGGQRMFQCEICDRMYRTEDELRAHFSTHDGILPHKCGSCGRGFKKLAELNKHNQRYHCDIRPFPCDLCDKSYVTLRELKIHTTVHTGELPYSCICCGKSYRIKATLRRHMFKYHSELPASIEGTSV